MVTTDERITPEERDELRREMAEYLKLNRYAESVLGMRGWTLVRSHGRMMSGPNTGMYVSGVPFAEARWLVEELVHGRRIDVHLMHRHRSGNYESSSLSLTDGRLTMHFTDRDELA